VEASDVCVTIADLTTPDGPLIFVNRAFNEMTGYERCDVVGRNCRFLQGPDTDPEAVAAMGAAIKSGRSLRQGKAPEGARVAGLSRAGLQQALTNLILNAADAMGGTGCVTVRLGGDEASVTLAVLDQGPGVDPDAAARMFEPFFTTKAPGAGAGLGLYIVHQLVERAGGVVTLCAAPGGGACFEMQFPRDRSGADQE
jgi:signal transduction histidine kinase